MITISLLVFLLAAVRAARGMGAGADTWGRGGARALGPGRGARGDGRESVTKFRV